MPSELRVALIGAALTKKCNINIAVYCKCDPDEKSGSLPFGAGFPNMPWSCQKCGKEVTDPDELSYDIELVPGTCFIQIIDHFLCRDMVFEVTAYEKIGETERLITTCGNSFFINQFDFIKHVENR